PTGLWAEELEDTGLSKDLIRLLGACVAARPERRPADAGCLAEQLDKLLDAVPPTEPDRTDFAAVPPEPAPPAPPPEPPAADPLVTLLETNPSFWLLDLTNKQIGDRGAVLLAQLPSLANRSVLYLSGNQVGDAGAAALAASPHLANVTRLILWDNLIGDAGAPALAASPYLANLTVVDVGGDRFG